MGKLTLMHCLCWEDWVALLWGCGDLTQIGQGVSGQELVRGHFDNNNNNNNELY